MSSRQPSPRAERRSRRKEAAIAASKRRQRNLLLLYVGLAALVVAAVLIVVNLPDDDNEPIDIDLASIPQEGNLLGSASAPVTLVESADFQCPACGMFATEALPQVIQDFVIPGQVSVEFRAFPFLGGTDLATPGNESVEAAIAAECARDQGQYWEYNHKLFEEQDGENDGAFSSDNLKRFAGELGPDQATFDTCLDSGEHRETVIDGFNAAQANGVNSTPTLFINGVQVAHTNQGYDLLKRQIEAALKGDPIPT
jgi:protein-disulfide isomerase